MSGMISVEHHLRETRAFITGVGASLAALGIELNKVLSHTNLCLEVILPSDKI